jgi:predicted Zn-dependent peptidase
VKRVEVKFKGEEAVLMAFLTVPDTHPDHDALMLCDMMLGNGSTGLIDVNLNQAQKVRNAGCQPQSLLDAGYQILTATPKPGQSLDELESLLLEQVRRLRQGEFTEDDLAATMTAFEVGEKRGLESNRNRVASMTDAFVSREPWERRVAALGRLKRIRKADVVATAQKYFGDSYVVVRRVNQEPEIPKIAKPNFTPVPIDATKPHSPFFSEVLAMPAPEIEPRFVVKGRDVQELALRSGKLVYAKNPVNDVFDLTFTVPGGTDHDPKLSLAFSLLDFGGAGELDGVALKRKLFALGSTFSAGAGRDDVTITVSGLESNLKATVDLLRKHFEAPTGVGQPDLEKLVQRAKAGRDAQKASPQGVAQALVQFAERGADSTFLKQPTNDEMKSWKADDLLAAARSVWDHPRTVTYVGQLPPEQVAEIVDLGPIGGSVADLRPAPARTPQVYVKSERDRVLFVDRNTAQTQVQLFAADGTFDRTQVPLSRVFNEMMGGSMSGIVFQEIRESRALAYSSGAFYAVPAWKEDENVLIGALGTQADKTIDALTVLVGLLRHPPFNDQRFESAKRSIDEGYRTNRNRFRQVASTWITWQRQGLDGDPRPWNRAQVQAMTLEQVSAWADRFVTKPFTVTVVGPKDRIDLERLKQFGDLQELTVDQLFAW